MTSTLPAHALFAAALLLALGFHRHRAAQVALLLWLLLVGADVGGGEPGARLLEGAQRFVPWLLLVCAAMPEPRLLSRRHAALLLLLAFLTALVLDAPPALYELFRALAAWPMGSLSAAAAASTLLLLAGLLCFARWILRGQPLELGLFFAIVLGAVGCFRADEAIGWFTAAAATALVAILYSSYRMAFIDQLTELPNRRALDETLSRLSGGYSLAMIDVDHFKKFNDTYGHEAGDRVLRAVAQNLRRNAGGRAFRFGGEEFCVVYGGSSAPEAFHLLEKARASIESQRVLVSIPVKGKARRNGDMRVEKAVAVTVSAGCAPRDERRRVATDVLEAADAALYRAKQRGRNRVVKA